MGLKREEIRFKEVYGIGWSHQGIIQQVRNRNTPLLLTHCTAVSFDGEGDLFNITILHLPLPSAPPDLTWSILVFSRDKMIDPSRKKCKVWSLLSCNVGNSDRLVRYNSYLWSLVGRCSCGWLVWLIKENILVLSKLYGMMVMHDKKLSEKKLKGGWPVLFYNRQCKGVPPFIPFSDSSSEQAVNPSVYTQVDWLMVGLVGCYVIKSQMIFWL